MIPRDYEEPMSFWEWVRIHLLTAIPGINLVMLVYWAFARGGKTSRRNYARAFLCFFLAVTLIVGLLAALSVPAAREIRDRSRAKMAELEARRAEEGAAAATAPAAPSAPQPPTTPLDEPMRTFRSADGRTIEARVIALTDDTVTIQRADGREFTSEMTRYSAEDVEYFMRLRNGGGAFD